MWLPSHEYAASPVMDTCPLNMMLGATPCPTQGGRPWTRVGDAQCAYDGVMGTYFSVGTATWKLVRIGAANGAWDDVLPVGYRCKIVVGTGEQRGILLAVQGANDWLAVALDQAAQQVQLVQDVASTITTPTTAPATLTAGLAYELTIRRGVSGEITAWLNGVQMFRAASSLFLNNVNQKKFGFTGKQLGSAGGFRNYEILAA